MTERGSKTKGSPIGDVALEVPAVLASLRDSIEGHIYREARKLLAEKVELPPLSIEASSFPEPWTKEESPSVASMIFLICAAVGAHVSWRLGKKAVDSGVDGLVVMQAQTAAVQAAMAHEEKEAGGKPLIVVPTTGRG